MLPLYFGYLVVQTYGIIDVFLKNTIAPSAAFFSIIVFLIWSFIPLLGYALAKACGAKTAITKPVLFLLGCGVALFENSWFYFDWLIKGEDLISTVLVFLLFFIIAYLPFSQTTKINKP